MIRRWIGYLGVWIAALIFYVCYQEWLGWLFLVGISCLPWLSLLVSLPAMLTAKLTLPMPQTVTVDTQVRAEVWIHAVVPLSRYKVQLVCRKPLSQEVWKMEPGGILWTDHCGTIQCSVHRAYVYDYLGFFCKPLKKPAPARITVRPRPVEAPELSPLSPARALRWKPKPGGGFSENYELRLYRPGDSVQRIHWKLSGKTGKLLLREPLEPADKPMLTLRLMGSPASLDRKLGILLQLGQELLEQGVSFHLAAQTGNGLLRREILAQAELLAALDTLLAEPPATAPQPLPRGRRVCYIGGYAHEEA